MKQIELTNESQENESYCPLVCDAVFYKILYFFLYLPCLVCSSLYLRFILMKSIP